MMLTISNLVSELKSKFPEFAFYNGCIDKTKQCFGVYARGNAPHPQAIGGACSYGVLPVTILVHWNNNSNDCEIAANTLYEGLEGGIATINKIRVVDTVMVDSCPVNIGRDEENNCEMTIRFNIFYERQ